MKTKAEIQREIDKLREKIVQLEKELETAPENHPKVYSKKWDFWQ